MADNILCPYTTMLSVYPGHLRSVGDIINICIAFSHPLGPLECCVFFIYSILDEARFYRPFLVQNTCMHIIVFTYIGLVQHHTHIQCFRDMQQSVSGTCQTHWLTYLLEEHAMLCCIELYFLC